MQVTLIGGATIDGGDIVFDFNALNNGYTPVFIQSSTGIVLDNLLKVASMDTLFSDAGWTFDRWNAWRAAHPYVATAYTPFQNQDNVPGTSVVENLANQNWLDTAANYYLDTFDTPAKKVGSALLAIGVIYLVYKVATSE